MKDRQIERTLETRSWLLLPLLVLLLGLQLVSPSKAWSYLLVGLVGLAGASYFWAREMRDHVAAQRSVHGTWVVAGDVLQEHWLVVNHSWLPVLWAEVTDRSNVPGYQVGRVVGCNSHGQYRWTTEGTCQQRGLFTLGPWELHLGDPFGLFRVRLYFADTETIIVYPRVVRLPPLDLPRGSAAGRGRSPATALESTARASSVRPYVPGDSLRTIHWRTTARWGALAVKIFDREPSGDLWIVVDLNSKAQAGSGSESTEEYAVVLAASLAAEWLRGGERRSVGVVTSGTELTMVPPAAGEAQLWRILQALAQVKAAPGRSLAQLLESLGPSLGQGLTVAVITPDNSSDWVPPLLMLQRQGLATAAILLDRASFLLPEEETPPRMAPSLDGLRGLLADHGVPGHVITHDFAFQPVIRYRRKRRELRVLPGTGRVISVEVEEEV
ncbi:MAG TPA: DUF58 domain-containing protein [Anaerolineae bacterium]|nr:DUF58 domain-containing protein [Anaerolineae bacterium]